MELSHPENLYIFIEDKNSPIDKIFPYMGNLEMINRDINPDHQAYIELEVPETIPLTEYKSSITAHAKKGCKYYVAEHDKFHKPINVSKLLMHLVIRMNGKWERHDEWLKYCKTTPKLYAQLEKQGYKLTEDKGFLTEKQFEQWQQEDDYER